MHIKGIESRFSPSLVNSRQLQGILIERPCKERKSRPKMASKEIGASSSMALTLLPSTLAVLVSRLRSS